MKNIFALFAAMAMLFVACEPAVEEPTPSSQQIKLTTDAAVSVNSGSVMGFIKYEIVEAVAGAEVKAEADVDWIGNFDLSSEGKIGYTVQANPDAEPRVGVVTVSYDKSSFTVTITQKLSEAPTNEQITAAYLQGKYYGVQQGLYNYYLAFSDLGLDSNDKYSVPNAHYYFVDLYLDVAPADMTNIVVPNGVYEFDITNSGFANTFTDSFSWYQINNEQGYALPEDQIHFEVGKLTVEDGKVTLEVRMQINYMQKTHVVTYEGAYSLIDCTNESY